MNVFLFTDIKSYLRRYISQLPKKGRGEISRIAVHLKISPTIVSHVLSGEKNFTNEQTQLLISYLGLTGFEVDYFTFLNQFERAGSHELKAFWKAKLEEIKIKSLKIENRLEQKRKLSEQERAVFYSSPLYMAVRLYTSVGEKGKSIAEIAQRFEIPMTRASEIVKFLVECSLCEEKNGRYIMGDQTIHLEKNSPHLLRFQTDWRMRALQRGEDLSDSELLFTAPVSLSEKDFAHLREEIISFIKKFLETVHASPADDVACLNIDWYWLKK